MTRDEIKFNVAYSMQLQRLQYTLYGRAESMLEALCVVSVVAACATGAMAWLPLALVAAVALRLWRPGNLAMRASHALANWTILFYDLGRLADADLNLRFEQAGVFDLKPIAALRVVAHRAAAQKLGLSEGSGTTLPVRSRLLAVLASE